MEVTYNGNDFNLMMDDSDYPDHIGKKLQILEVKSDNSYLYLVDPIIRGIYEDGTRIKVSFGRYYKSYIMIADRFIGSEYNHIYNRITYYFNLCDHLLKDFEDIKNIKFQLYQCSIQMTREGKELKLAITGDYNDLKSLNLFPVVFINYIYYLTGRFCKQSKVTEITQGDETIYQHYIPVLEGYECSRFSHFSVNPTEELITNSFERFYSFFVKNKYPLDTFFFTQSNLKYRIQQRVSLLLNSLEGLMKRTFESKETKIDITSKESKSIKRVVKQHVKKYLESEEFGNHIEAITDSNKEEIVRKLTNSIGRFDELSFDETLELSKKINPHGFVFVKSINPMPMKFWKRCKDHRNFHAHLSNDDHNGFDGTQSLFALYILSTYFRLLCLQLSGIKIGSQSIVEKESSNITRWIADNNLEKGITDVDKI